VNIYKVFNNIFRYFVFIGRCRLGLQRGTTKSELGKIGLVVYRQDKLIEVFRLVMILINVI